MNISIRKKALYPFLLKIWQQRSVKGTVKVFKEEEKKNNEINYGPISSWETISITLLRKYLLLDGRLKVNQK